MITTIKQFKLLESINKLNFKLPEKNIYDIDFKNIDISDIELIDKESIGLYIPIDVVIKNQIINSIKLDIQIIDGLFYQLHIFLHQDIQNIGLGFKIYEKILLEFGHIYSNNKMRSNSNILKILNKFKNDNRFLYFKNNKNDVLVINNITENKEELITKFNERI